MARLPAEQALAKGKSMDDAAEQVSFGYEQVSREEKTRRVGDVFRSVAARYDRSEEHTSELQSLMRISYAVFCLKKKTKKIRIPRTTVRIITKICRAIPHI